MIQYVKRSEGTRVDVDARQLNVLLKWHVDLEGASVSFVVGESEEALRLGRNEVLAN